MRRRITLLLGLIAVCLTGLLVVACHTASDSWMDPSMTGAFEAVPGRAPQSADALSTQLQQAMRDGHANAAHPDKPIAITNPHDDLWIIVKPPPRDPDAVPANEVTHPGSGAMLAMVHDPRPCQAENTQQQQDNAQTQPAEPELLPLPLKHTDVRASVAGYIASVNVTQQFHNPFDETIEAVYQFPLPQDAAVNGFVMTVGPPEARRRIRGIVREKEEAERIYRAARARGHNASLLTQVRPNIFEQKVANIEPGRQIDIGLTYFHTLSYADGWYMFVFPMVVGPRYNPPYPGPGSDDPVRAVPNGGAGASTVGNRGLQDQAQQQGAGGTTIPYLRPGERSGHDIALSLDIDAGVAVEAFASPTHAVHYLTQDANDPQASHKLQVRLNDNDHIPNRDFVFRFRVAGDAVKPGLVIHEDAASGGGFFTLMLYPPAELGALERRPMEMIFVLDCSGSMRGEPLAQAKQAVRRALRHLTPEDTFQVVRFSSNASALGGRPLRATPRNIERGLRYVDQLEGGGGTEMIEGIKHALDFPQDRDNTDRHRVVTFLTDGFIGNEQDILREVHARLGDTRLFSFGVGTSVNRYLLERLAKAGRGAAAYLLPGDSANDVMDLYFHRVSRPALAGLAIDFGQARVTDVYPARLPDLVVGRPVVVTGRYTGALQDIRVTGRAGGRDLSITVNADSATTHPALAPVWARRKIAEAMDRLATVDRHDDLEQAALKKEVLDTALAYQLMSQYTAFIAVDASRLAEGGGEQGPTVTQPLPVPEGVDHDTTVGGGGE